jgi:hypothetical protein
LLTVAQLYHHDDTLELVEAPAPSLVLAVAALLVGIQLLTSVFQWRGPQSNRGHHDLQEAARTPG